MEFYLKNVSTLNPLIVKMLNLVQFTIHKVAPEGIYKTNNFNINNTYFNVDI
ncbi:hypothetical protein HMPREF9148_01691 [Prevotella sp. F0091]|nr:hypothetical protein HMPREF9148_01691 [Prevotella sp. F0091]